MQLVAGGCDADMLATDGMAAMHRAVLLNQLESVRALILSGTNLNVQDANGDSSLHVCVYNTWLVIKLFLITAGCA